MYYSSPAGAGASPCDQVIEIGYLPDIDCRSVAVRDCNATPSDHDTPVEVTNRHGDGRTYAPAQTAQDSRAPVAAGATACAATHVRHRGLGRRRGHRSDRGRQPVIPMAATAPLCDR